VPKPAAGVSWFPPANFFTGAIHLKSGVNLHFETNAVLKFSTDPKAYLPAVFTRFEGMECWNYSPLIYAYGQENIAVTGDGTLDGQADAMHWWSRKGREAAARKRGRCGRAAGQNGRRQHAGGSATFR